MQQQQQQQAVNPVPNPAKHGVLTGTPGSNQLAQMEHRVQM